MSEKPVTKKVKDATKPKKGEEEGKKVLQKKNFDSYALYTISGIVSRPPTMGTPHRRL